MIFDREYYKNYRNLNREKYNTYMREYAKKKRIERRLKKEQELIEKVKLLILSK